MDRKNVHKSPLPERDKESEKSKKISIDMASLIKYYNKAVECSEKTLILEGNEMDVKYAYYLILHNLEKLNLTEKYIHNKENNLFNINE